MTQQEAEEILALEEQTFIEILEEEVALVLKQARDYQIENGEYKELAIDE